MNLVRAAIIALVVSPLAMAQTWTFPAKGTGVPCTGCGTVSSEGKLTFPYDEPLSRHAGRFVDSTRVTDFQTKVRTLRGGIVRVVPSRGRIYTQLGSVIGAYSLDTYFTTVLRRPMADVRLLVPNVPRGSYPYETFAAPHAFHNAESTGSGWTTPMYDGQDRLYDFDADDRGYLYIATGSTFGWGIEYDEGATDGSLLPLIHQKIEGNPQRIVSLRSGSSYFMALSSSLYDGGDLKIYDVTTASAPVLQVGRSGGSWQIKEWARDDERQRLAMINVDGHLRVYEYATLAGNPALTDALIDMAPATGKVFVGLTYDSVGNLWLMEGPSSTAVTSYFLRLAPTASGYAETRTIIEGGAIAPRGIAVGAGFVAVVGRSSVPGSHLRLFRLSQGELQLLDTAGFFQKYYHPTDPAYASAGPRTEFKKVFLFEQASKSYLIYSTHALGDVYELQRGDAIRIGTDTSLAVTPNPAASGDEVSMVATVTPHSTGIADPVGAVTFTVDGTASATVPLVADGGQFRGTFVRSGPWAAEPVRIVATYEGDDHHSSSSSMPVDHFSEVPPAPQGLDGTLAGGDVKLTWQRIPSIGRYQVLRREGASFSVIHDGTWDEIEPLAFTDTTVAAGVVYVYRVRGVGPTGVSGPESSSVAVGTITFSDPALAAGDPIRPIHFSELRVAANAYRAAAGLSAVTFTDATLTAGGAVRAVHIAELRDGFNAGRTALGLPPFLTTATPGVTVVQASDVLELRQALQ
jgi:hypothetical protein